MTFINRTICKPVYKKLYIRQGDLQASLHFAKSILIVLTSLACTAIVDLKEFLEGKLSQYVRKIYESLLPSSKKLT